MSTIKKKPLEEEQQEEKAKVVEVQPFISAKSNQLAYRRDIANICSVVGNVDECTRDNLDRIMKELKIIDATTTEEELKHVEKEYKHCLIGENVYSAKKLEAKLVDSVTLRRNRKFNVFVNGKLIIARANEKAAIEQHEEEPEPVKCSSTMQKETYERLLASKPAIVAEPETTQEPTTGLISRGSKFILQKSHRAQEISQMSLEERDHFLTKLRDETVHKLEVALKEEEEKEMHIKPHNLGALPQFYEQLPAEVKQRATPTKKVIEEQYKPKTTSYAEFLQKKDKIFNTETKVAGVEERVKRLRLARIERNELQEALDPRALPAELKNLKKKAHKKKAHKKPAPETKTEEIVEGCTDEIDDILGI
ncbi:hypothetical protein TRFO_43182 [Tritrichomonas foetus]|uniref:Uncharacterized protein n=1 Tax=Tritrichomonas foetus TaxID=1144522 RepID=A0A1J4KRX4_9EUKA|nr:hypothetical protein TRFO_43182 [Tritrichomonas foetus]|eukprot:OHT14041.1 hypothetical protein TRFO_43182 [Tritrichomonas foetus]